MCVFQLRVAQQNDACEQLVRSNLGNLGRSADGRTVVYRSLDLEVRTLRDVCLTIFCCVLLNRCVHGVVDQ